jgi:hypothetical protein
MEIVSFSHKARVGSFAIFHVFLTKVEVFREKGGGLPFCSIFHFVPFSFFFSLICVEEGAFRLR